MKKSITIIVLMLVVCGLGYWIIQLNKKIIQLDKVKHITAKNIQAEASIIARKVDKAGLEHVTIEAAENIIPSRKGEPAVSPGILDTTAMAIGILKKQVQELTVVNSKLKAEYLRAVKDTSGVYRYKDRWLNLSFKTDKDSIDLGSFDFEYDADLTIAQYWKRSWFLGAKKSYIDIYSNDPRTTIRGVKRLVVEQKQPNYGLRVQAGGLYNLKGGEYGFGPGIRIDLGRFSISGNYYYYPLSEDWKPSVNGNYDIVRF